MKTRTLRPATRILAACLFALSVDVFGATLFTPNNQPEGWVGDVAVTSYDFSSGIEIIYKGDFIVGEWSGNLLGYPVTPDGNILYDAEIFSGGVVEGLDGQDYNTGRMIFTMKKDGTKIPFRWASLDSSQQSPLGSSSVGPLVLNFLRGDRSNEDPAGQKFRTRAHVLGDIVHSRPLYVYDANNPMVYVGANDGMLHAFDADDGNEVWAYMPSFFLVNSSTNYSFIKNLTTNPYVHNYYVDASPTAANVTIGGTAKRILVGGAGAGGKGLFALDITDPTPPASETAAASKLLWEITPSTVNNANSTAYADLGHTYGVPVIAQVSDGTWAAIVGNGYNNQGSNQAVLYVINLQTGAKIAGVTATVSGVSNSAPNGLSSVAAIDTDRDGKVDYVYAGDFNGNLWKFDLRNIASPTATKLFTTSPAQPITGRPNIALHPQGGFMVTFGTGRMFTSADSTDASTTYSAYGIWDNGTTIDPTKIVSQTLTAKTWTGPAGLSFNVRVSSSNAVTYTGTTPNQGWKLALPVGERVVGDGGVITNSRYTFASYNPTITHAAVAGVTQPQGDNWLNEVDFLSGGGGTKPMFDLDGNLTLDDLDRVRDSGGTNAQAGPSGIPISRYIAAGIMSQPIVAKLASLAETYFNTNPDASTTVTSGGGGVSNGHFDFDIYYTCTGGTKFSCGKNTHVHQYDDKYNVTGVDMQNASLAAFNLVNAITSTSTRFKILLANQGLSPAAKLKIGTSASDPWIPVYNYLTPTASLAPPALGTGTTLHTNTPFSDVLPVYQRSSLLNLYVALPLNAFTQLDWQHGGVTCSPATNSYCMVGLVPTATGCVHGNNTGYDPTTVTALEPYGGLWMNAALTIQIVKETTPDSAIQMENPSFSNMGYRLKGDAASMTNLLAQYTIFWHHPNGKCYGGSGWGNNGTIAYPDTAGAASASATAPGSDDPTGGSFIGSGGGASGGGGQGGGSLAGGAPSTTTIITLADGSILTVTTTQNADGSITITRVPSGGGAGTTQTVIPRQDISPTTTGRVAWRELIRP